MSKKIADVEAGTVTFDFGESGKVLFELDKCSEAMIRQLAIHGASQKGGDSYAGAKTATEGTDVDPNDWSYQQAKATVDAIYADEWTSRTGGGSGVTDLAVALAEVADIEQAAAVAVLEEKTKEEKAALRKYAPVAAVLSRIRRERAEEKEKKMAAAAEGMDASDLQKFLS